MIVPITLRTAALTLTIAIFAASCGGDDPSSAGGGADETSSTTTSTTTSTTVALGQATGTAESPSEPSATEPPATTEPTATTTTTTAPTTAPTTTTNPPSAADCLVGTWSLRSQEFLDEIVTTLPIDAGLSEWSHVSGDYLITLAADGTTRGQRLAWTHRIATPQGALVTTIDSDDAGTYTVDGNTISVTDGGGDATVSLALEVGGVLQPLPFGNQQTVQAPAVSGTGTFECSGDLLSIVINDLPDGPPGGFRARMDRIG